MNIFERLFREAEARRESMARVEEEMRRKFPSLATTKEVKTDVLDVIIPIGAKVRYTLSSPYCISSNPGVYKGNITSKKEYSVYETLRRIQKRHGVDGGERIGIMFNDFDKVFEVNKDNWTMFTEVQGITVLDTLDTISSFAEDMRKAKEETETKFGGCSFPEVKEDGTLVFGANSDTNDTVVDGNIIITFSDETGKSVETNGNTTVTEEPVTQQPVPNDDANNTSEGTQDNKESEEKEMETVKVAIMAAPDVELSTPLKGEVVMSFYIHDGNKVVQGEKGIATKIPVDVYMSIEEYLKMISSEKSLIKYDAGMFMACTKETCVHGYFAMDEDIVVFRVESITDETSVEEEVIEEETSNCGFNVVANDEDNVDEAAINDMLNAVANMGKADGRIWHFMKSVGTTTKKDTTERIEGFVDNCKANFGIIDTLLSAVGFNSLKNSIRQVIDAGMLEGSKTSLRQMALKCDQLVRDELEYIQAMSSNPNYREVFTLKTILNDGRSIFETIVICLLWVAKKICSCIKQWFGIDESKLPKPLQAICSGIRSLFQLLINGVKIILSVTGYIASFVVAGVVKVGYWLYNTVKKMFNSFKEWVGIADTADDDTEKIPENIKKMAESLKNGVIQ